jgi:hypothetical protein
MLAAAEAFRGEHNIKIEPEAGYAGRCRETKPARRCFGRNPMSMIYPCPKFQLLTFATALIVLSPTGLAQALEITRANSRLWSRFHRCGSSEYDLVDVLWS